MEDPDYPAILAAIQRGARYRRNLGWGEPRPGHPEGPMLIRDWNLFLAFLIVDGSTAGKSREPLRWFFCEVAGRGRADITAADILE